MVHISEFNRGNKTIMIESVHGSLRLTFEEWKFLVDAYKKLIKGGD